MPSATPPPDSALTADTCVCVAASACSPGDTVTYGQGSLDIRELLYS